MTSIEHKSPKIHQFAEDLLNEHITRSLVNFSSATETKDQPIEFLQPSKYSYLKKIKILFE